MNTIVCNTLTGAVSEYTRYAFQSITPTHGGSAAGLFAIGGDTDDGLIIASSLRMPPTLRENTLKKNLDSAYLSMEGQGTAQFVVFGKNDEWSYEFPLRDSGVTRADPGKGIRQNYLGFGLRTPRGQQFKLDRIEVTVYDSKTRRI